MKKAVFLILFIYLSCIIIPISASAELLENGSFEQGMEYFIHTEAEGQYELTENTASSGTYCAYLFARTNKNICIQYDIKSVLEQNGMQYYCFSVAAKLDDRAFDFSKFRAVVKIVTDKNEFIYSGSDIKITNERFTLCTGSTNILWQGTILQACLYLENCTKNEYPNLFVDDFSLSFSPADIPSASEAPETLSFAEVQTGALRRDIWDDSCKEAQAAAAELWPLRYRSLLPFHTAVQDTVRFGHYKEIIDVEIAFAEYAGIDFWAYYWLKDSGAYQAHRTSTRSSAVKLCFVLDKTLSAEEIQEMTDYFSLDCYFKLAQRPILFLEDDAYETLELLLKRCSEQNTAAPYIILISQNNVQAHAKGIDAIAPAGNSQDWQNALSYTKNIVPMVCCGESKKNPFPAQKIAQSVEEALRFCSQTSAIPGCILIDAWNKNLQGSFIIPTLCFDKEGNAVIENGRCRLDTSRIDALHNILNPNGNTDILRYYGTYPSDIPEPSPTTVSAVPGTSDQKEPLPDSGMEEEEATANISETDGAAENEILIHSNNAKGYLWLLAGIFLLTAAIVILIILFKRKQRNEKESRNHGS